MSGAWPGPAWSAEARVRGHASAAAAEPAILDGDGVLTWAGLEARVEAAAATVRAAGVAPGTLVAIETAPARDAIAAILGTLRAEAMAAPLPGGRTRAERVAAMDVLRPSLVLDPRSVGGAAVVPYASPAAGRPFEPEAPAVVVLTSGTTGRPKGVVLSGRALAASADAWLAALPPATGWVLATGLAHVAGLGVVWRAIARRVPLRVADPGDATTLLAALRGEPPMSHVSLVPAQLARLLDATGDAPPPPGLRAVLLGGGPIPAALVCRAVGGGWPVVTTYGLSEAGSGVTALPADEAAAAPASAGYPLPGVTLRIDRPDADGVGEIVVETPARCTGYLGESQDLPASPLRTGDLGRLDAAGRLVVIDRRTDRIVRGGENVAPAEVEAVLLAHPAVADAAVVARADPVLGHVPVAAIVLVAAADPGDGALAAHCRASLAGFKVPAAFLRLDALPRTAGGKLRRDAVRALVDGSRTGELARPGGDAIGWRVTGAGRVPVLLLHGTLSTSAQLERLAAELAQPGDITVHAIDRRGSGTSRLAGPAPVDVAVHVADLVAYLDARGIGAAAAVGISFGGALALELAARHPERVLAVVAWEPPYGPLADDATRVRFATLARRTAEAHRSGGAAAAAETFLRAVAGDAAWDRLPERGRLFLEREGDGALADASLAGLDPDGLARIAAPTTLLTGGASDPYYTPIADALVARIPRAGRRVLDDAAHPAPITDPVRFAAAVRPCLELRP